MAKRPTKGVAGKKTGSSARKAIRSAKKRGATTTSIAKSAKRNPTTITDIELGVIKNPPRNLAANVRKAKATASKPVKRTMASKKKRLKHK